MTQYTDGQSRLIRVALVSGGRESTAMVKIMEDKFGKDFFTEKLFADTGDDPLGVQTNWFLEKYCGWKIVTVYSKYGKIREYYENKIVDNEPEFIGHALPSQANKDCSGKFKIIPECKHLFETYGSEATYELYFGFSDNKKDKNRAKRMKKILSKSKIRQVPKFPLIDYQIDRDKAGKICLDFMGFIPERSLCVMCFERTIDDWKHAYKIMPRAIEQVIKFEESSKLFKKYGYGLAVRPIRKLLRLKPKEQQTLDFTKACPCVESFDMDIMLDESKQGVVA